MNDPYEGREQTETKHLILRAYIQSLVFKVAHKASRIAFVDGFSGPWESRAASYRDTSFGIALRCLKETQAALRGIRRKPHIQAIFCEKDPVAYSELDRFASGFASDDFEVLTLNDEFSNTIDQVAARTADAFRLLFVDPKGWTGYGFQGLSKISGKNSEVIINFMYDHSNRFFGDSREKIKSSFYDVFEEAELHRIASSQDRENEAIAIFSEKLKSICRYQFVAHSRVSRPKADRTQFILFFGTNSLAGLEVFRDAEDKAQANFAFVRAKARERDEEDRLQQSRLPGLSEQLIEAEWRAGRKAINKEVKGALLAHIQKKPSLPYAEYKAELLQKFSIRRTEINAIIKALGKEGIVSEAWKEGNRRKQVPPDECKITPAG